jgi:hypothetical protein
MPFYTEEEQKAEDGVDLVRAEVRKAGCIFREITKNDKGIDALIELVNTHKATGDLIAVQVKAGPSYWDKARSFCTISLKKDWLSYWQSFCLPVVIVVCDLDTQRASWLDLHRYLVENPEILRKRVLSFPAHAWLTADTIRNDFPELSLRMVKPGLPRLPRNIVSRAEAALERVISIAVDLDRSGYDPASDGGKHLRFAFSAINLHFDGEITCIDVRGICTLHNDPRLVGRKISLYRDMRGQYVFRSLRQSTYGSILWVDDFDADVYDPAAGISQYIYAAAGKPTRVNLAVYTFFEPWRWHVAIEAHSKIWP